MPTSLALLETAERLFVTRGITATGVDVIAREAGVSKPTLYSHFGSKQGLVRAVFARRADRVVSELRAERGLLDVVDRLLEHYAEPGSRGCAFLNAAAELPDADLPGRAAIRAEKAALLDLLERRARAAMLPSPARVASQLLLVLDGVAARAVVGGPAAAQAALHDARTLVDDIAGPRSVG